MSDLSKYINKRKASDPEFKNDFDKGYKSFKIGAMLQYARETSGLTQEEIAAQLNTKKSSISRNY